jgi:peptide/nickel transport system substrate-binding protein
VRLALSRAWNRAEAAKALYPPEGADLIDGPYPAGAPENAPEIKHTAYDPAEAARMLDAAGLLAGPDGVRRRNGKKVSLDILYPSDQPIYAQISEVFRAAVQKLGIEVVARPFDWAAYSQRYAAGEFDVSPLGQQFLPPNLDQYAFFHSSQAPPAGLNAGFYRNPAADRALEAARREMDDARRLELLRTVHRLLAADPPADFLWSVDQYWAVSSRLDGVEVSPVGLFHFLPGPLAWRAIPARR